MRVRRKRLRWHLSALLVPSVMAVGLLGSWALAAAVDSEHQAHAQVVMDQRVQVIDSAVAAEVRRYIETTADLAAAIGAQSDLSASDFTALASSLDGSRLPGVSAVSLVVPATDDEIPRLQRQWRARGARQLSLAPAGAAEEHLILVLNYPLDGMAPRTGQDLSVAVEQRQAMAASRTGGEVTASLTYLQPGDGDRTSEQQRSFVLAAAVVGGLGTAIEGEFQGWLLVEMQGRDFIVKTIDMAAQHVVAATLIDYSPHAAVGPVAQVSPGQVVADPALERQVDVQVAGRTWQLKVQPTTRFVASLGPSLSAPAGGAGVLFTLLLAILVGILASSRSRALASVESATRALRADITRRELVEAALLAREELHTMALTDSLTGLANRRAFIEQLDQSHARALRHGDQVCVLFCDVDHFKTINDTYGHAVGDVVLQQIATRLRDHFRTEDSIGRLGGDEFAVICENESAASEVLLDRVHDALATPYLISDDLIAATVSIGIASLQEGENATEMLDRADSSMYRAKAARQAV